jgi:DEAD/DEAH box helicase domain-containing protein
MMGSRAPSLLSVAISDMFTSPYNADKKLLAFTDSVQDASHRAGFFGARTYRFNVRTAIQGLLEPEQPTVPLTEYAERMFEHWLPHITKQRLIPTLMPPDLREYPRYLAFLESNGKGVHTRLQEDLIDRLSWEITMEYGLRSRVGRTLETTRCSTLQIDGARLDEAADRLTLELNEESILDGKQEGFEPAQIRHLLVGLLNRTRLRGGIVHSFLEPYIKNGGNAWLLRKARVPLMSPFSRFSVYPRFLTNYVAASGARGDTFDSIVASTTSHTWPRDWVSRCLSVPVNEPGTNELYKRVMSVLTAVGLLREFQGRSNSKVWGIDPKVISITADTAVVECPQCSTESVIPKSDLEHWDGKTCTMYRCKGNYSIAAETKESYYSHIYKSGQLYRVFPDEHTGLLGRAAREDIEEAFRSQSRPNGPNLLVATPTLEMGIDIGDLSALVLCAVPPTTANFIQRVGRAGRKTGNALCLTLVNARPHDLYFYEAPEEMMSGAVVPPGCFLDTPEMLKRQLVAHGMDAWAREDEDAGSIPPQVRYIKKTSDPSKFPSRFIKYYREHSAHLTESFLNRFTEELSTGNRQSLKDFGEGDAVSEHVVGAFDRVRAERDELTKTRNRIREQIKTLEKNKEEVDDAEERIKDLKFARAVIGRLIEEQGSKYPLNVLTDEGVLPNYAFPEAGVTLDSVIRDDKDDGQREFSSREFIRPASSAIRELAPFNTFYAEGRKVRIDEIDIGSSARPLTEKWRLCAECSYAERVTDDDAAGSACPRCGDTGAWPDSGQLRTMVNFRRSRSLATRLEASTVDDSDDREEEFYKTADLIDVATENCHGAQLISDLPFGFELLKDLRLREVNFGREFEGGGQGFKVAGMPIGDRGFDVCMDCGKVRGVNAAEIEHAPYCKSKRTHQEVRIESVFLYRQIQSEAIRVLMPFADVSLDERRASFKAALELGFRRHFQGDPVHLQIKESREPITGGGYRQYLVIFDGVPGGTGYLSELWRSANFMDVLQMALTALQSCDCQKVENKDGCYRCLFAYQRQKELALISSREAQQTLSDILSKRNDLAPIHTLSEVSLDQRLESELEEKFIAALAARCGAQDECTWREVVQGGEIRWQLSVDGCDWEIGAQVNLGSKQGVTIASKPDFVIKRLNGSPHDKPVAVFCDGFAYHGCPGKTEGRIWDDVVKRQSLIDSGKFLKWSVTWKDVELFEKGKGSAPTIFESTKGQRLNAVANSAGLTLPRELGKTSNMELIWQYLMKPDPDQWRCLANVWSVAWLASDPLMDPEQIDPIEKQLLTDEVVNRPAQVNLVAGPGAIMGRVDWGEYGYTLMSCVSSDLQIGNLDTAKVVLRLDDSAHNRAAHDFESSWRSFLQAWNLLQFRENVEIQTSERIRLGGDEIVEPDSQILRVAEEAPEGYAGEKPQLSELLEYSAETVKPFLHNYASTGLTLPTLDYELDVGTERCGPEPELSWPEFKVAILADNQLEDRRAFENQGWKVFLHPLDSEEVTSEIRLRMTEAVNQEDI